MYDIVIIKNFIEISPFSFFEDCGVDTTGGEENETRFSFRLTPQHNILVLSLFRLASINLVSFNFFKNPNIVQ